MKNWFDKTHTIGFNKIKKKLQALYAQCTITIAQYENTKNKEKKKRQWGEKMIL